MTLDTFNGIELNVFANRLEAVCDEMGELLKRSAFSPNIKDRLDFSCALFDADGELCAQAAHIPVHLGSMAFAMRDIVKQQNWQPDQMLILNDPFLGGTHLPDVTVVSPSFIAEELIGFVVNRAHHANIGADTPGSMPISQSLEEEGVVIPPTLIVKDGVIQQAVLDAIVSPSQQLDLIAQISTNQMGLSLLQGLINEWGVPRFNAGVSALNAYALRVAEKRLAEIPNGEYTFSDMMDDDGVGTKDIAITLSLCVDDSRIVADFTGTSPQVKGNINCPLSVTAAAVYYVFRCLMPDSIPACAGLFQALTLRAPEGCLLNARRPAATAAGNVETSTRVVDVVLGALAQAIPNKIPAASHGSMNNIAMGYVDADTRWDYYETIGGGMGASPVNAGLHGVQTHMTNTLNTPAESVEMHYPLRVRRYQLRRGSGGDGLYNGGDGIVREFEFLTDAQVSVITERRSYAPWGLSGGEAGQKGENSLNGKALPAKVQLQAKAGDRLTIATPGGGGWGKQAP